MRPFVGTAGTVLLILAGGLSPPASAAPVRFWGSDAELTVAAVSGRTVRVTVAPLDEKGVPKPGSPSTVLVVEPRLDQVKLRTRELNGPETVAAGMLKVTVKPNPLTITVTRAPDRVVQELIVADDGSVTFRTPAPVFGMGEGGPQFDRRGQLYPMRNGQIAPMLNTHGATIPVPFFIGTDGWAMFVQKPWGQYDLRDNATGKLIPEVSPRKGVEQKGSEPLDVFLTALDEPADALAEYVRLTGRPVMPPKWVLGYVQSHRTLANPSEPMWVVKSFREKNLPLDAVIYLGTGYTADAIGAGWNMGHGSVEFNPRTFDRPAEMLKALHDQNVKVVLHINAAPRNMFGLSMTEKSDNPIHISNYWTKHRGLETLDVDGWWPDDGDELPVEARLARHRCYYEGPVLDKPNVRPWSLHRNGYAGAARYGGWIWSGDPQSRWATLAAHVPVGINHSLSLTPFWSSDTGGFVATNEMTGELYTRWFQFSAFNALFRSHGRNWKLHLPFGWNTGEIGAVESPAKIDPTELRNAAVEPICKTYLELRYKLLPYNYTLMRQAHDHGLPPMRALWLHYPNDPEAVALGTEYLWGRDILVAPVVEKGAKSRKLYLPEGTWYDWWTGEKLAGKKWIERPVDLATMPLYVRAGAIIPLDPVRQYTSQELPVSVTTLRVYPGADGESALYDDDGKSLSYLDGSDAKTVAARLHWDDKARRLTIVPDPRAPGPAARTGKTFAVEVADREGKKTVQYAGGTTVVEGLE